MIHSMKIKEKYFNFIKYGTKYYEIRLNDEKRKNIKDGDFIELQKETLLEEKILVMVDKIEYYKNIAELLDNIEINHLIDLSISKEEFKEELELFYPLKKQKKYGVIAIRLNKDIIIRCSHLNAIISDDNIFQLLRENYDNFDNWLKKIQSDNVSAFYTEKNNELTSIMILKLDEIDSQQFLEKGKIMKIRTLIVSDKNKGIGTRYLKIIDDIAIKNNIKYIYLTIKINNKGFIKFIERKSYKRYNEYNDEIVYFKEL